MSEVSKLYAKIQQLELAIKGIGKTIIPIQEYIRPEIVKFTGHIKEDMTIDLQPQELYNVSSQYWFFIRNFYATATPTPPSTGLPSNFNMLIDMSRIEFNLADSGRGYNFFEKPIGLDLFVGGNGLNSSGIKDFNGILIKDGANIRCILSTYGSGNFQTGVGGYTVKVYLIGDYISPNYLAYYFHKIRKM